jgi:hypothetical protein
MSSRADSLHIPAGSPFATGWRSQLAAMLLKHSLADVMDAVAAFSELCCNHDPDDCSRQAELEAVNWARWATPAKRRIEACAVPRGPGRPRKEEDED